MEDHAEHATLLFGAYFHPDFLDDDPEWESVVERFRTQESPQTVRSTRDELIALLDRVDEPGLEAFLFAPNWRSFFDPRPGGLALRKWIEEIVHLLAGGSRRDSESSVVEVARKRAVALAQQVLAGSKDILLGCRGLAELRFSVGIAEDDPDFTCFGAIDSEIDSLPIGLARSQWSPEALREKEGDIERARAWARDFGQVALMNVVRRFGDAG